MRPWARILCCWILPVASLPAQGVFRIRDGDRVLFCGERPADMHAVGPLLESYIATRFPAWNVSFRHSGWAGADTAADVRLESELIKYKPAEVVLFARGLEGNAYRRIVMMVGRDLPEAGVTLVGAERHGDARPSGSRPPLLVRLRPGSAQVETAEAILSAWGAPVTATEVELDIFAGEATRAENTRIHDLEIFRVLSWSQDDLALPAPGALSRASRELLRVRGLPERRYLLTIDGEKIATFWWEQLDRGVDLATVGTPMARQADAVHRLTMQRAALDCATWTPACADASEREASRLVQRRRDAAQPRTRDYELQPFIE